MAGQCPESHLNFELNNTRMQRDEDDMINLMSTVQIMVNAFDTLPNGESLYSLYSSGQQAPGNIISWGQNNKVSRLSPSSVKKRMGETSFYEPEPCSENNPKKDLKH